MVTHDPVAASYTDRILFLADGKIVDELRDPDRDTILERMGKLQGIADRKAG
jgi:putative ABC transport system ATP-binding protein